MVDIYSKYYALISAIGREVVKDLKKKYPNRFQANGKFNMTGLCHEATTMFIKKINPILEKECVVIGAHGEICHHPRVLSKHWDIQHTWCVIKYKNQRVYVDLTLGQFDDIFDDIPNVYIDTKKPKWFYDDDHNIRWRILENIGFGDWYEDVIQYGIWAIVSDVIHVLLYRD